jgi:hypothetical protein
VENIKFVLYQRYELDEGEYVLSMEAVTLESKQTASGVKLYIAVGTAYYRGEDLSTRGRVSFIQGLTLSTSSSSD